MKHYKINYNLVGGKYLDVLLYKYFSSISITNESLFVPLISLDFINSYPEKFDYTIDIEELKKRYSSILDKYSEHIDYLSKKKYIDAFAEKINRLKMTNEFNIISVLKEEALDNISFKKNFLNSLKYNKYKEIYQSLKSRDYVNWLKLIIKLNNETYKTLYFETKNDILIKDSLEITNEKYINLMKIDNFIKSNSNEIDQIIKYRDSLKQDIKDHTLIIKKVDSNFSIIHNNLRNMDQVLYYYFSKDTYEKILNRKNLYKATIYDLNIFDIDNINNLKTELESNNINFKYGPNLNIFTKNEDYTLLKFEAISKIIKNEDIVIQDPNPLTYLASNKIWIELIDGNLELKSLSKRRRIQLGAIGYDTIYCIPITYFYPNINLLNSLKIITEYIVNKHVYQNELEYFEKKHDIDGNEMSYHQIKNDRHIISGTEYESKNLFSIYSKIIDELNNNLYALKNKHRSNFAVARQIGHDSENNYRILNGYEYGERGNGNPIGELDLVILDDNNFIVAIAEIKNYLDGANEGYIQLKKFTNYVKNRNPLILSKDTQQISVGIYPDLYKKIMNNTPIENNKYIFLVLSNKNYAGISNSKATYRFVGKLIKENNIKFNSSSNELELSSEILSDDNFKIIDDLHDYTYEILEKYKKYNINNLVIIEDIML